MTVIAAYHGTNSFVFGADTGVDYGDCRMTTCEDKIRKEHNWVIGMAGDGAAIVQVEFHPEVFKTDSIKTVAETMHGVLDEACEQMAVVRQPVGERWAVVKHVLRGRSLAALGR